MAKTNETGTNETGNGVDTEATVAWTQPTRYISVPVGEHGRGHFVEVPRIDWVSNAVGLDAVCDYMASEAKAAVNAKAVRSKDDPNAEREEINRVVTAIAKGTYDAGDISGRDDFNRALLAAARDTLRNALVNRGIASPTDAMISEAFKNNYPRAMELFGAQVAATGYEPAKKNVGKGSGEAPAKVTTGGLI